MYLSQTTNFWRATFNDYKKFPKLKSIKFGDVTVLLGRADEVNDYTIISAMFPNAAYKAWQAQIKAYYLAKFFE